MASKQLNLGPEDTKEAIVLWAKCVHNMNVPQSQVRLEYVNGGPVGPQSGPEVRATAVEVQEETQR